MFILLENFTDHPQDVGLLAAAVESLEQLAEVEAVLVEEKVIEVGARVVQEQVVLEYETHLIELDVLAHGDLGHYVDERLVHAQLLVVDEQLLPIDGIVVVAVVVVVVVAVDHLR